MAATFGTFGGPRFSVSTGGPEPDPLPDDSTDIMSFCAPFCMYPLELWEPGPSKPQEPCPSNKETCVSLT